MTEHSQSPKRPAHPSKNATPHRNNRLVKPQKRTPSKQPPSKQPQSADDDILDFAKVNYLTVTRQQHDQRVDNFLLGRLKGLPRSRL